VSDALREQTKTAYDTVAAAYAALLPDTSYEAPLDLAMVQHFVDQVTDGRPARILDAGCGTGRMITCLSTLRPSLTFTGLDLSSAMLDRARVAHPTAVFVEGDLAALPFDDEHFDAVLAWYSIIHTPPHQLGSIFDGFYRVLRPGGSLLLAYQAGTGERELSRPYGHEVELRAFLHHTPYVQAALRGAGLMTHTLVDRSARPTERHAQGFVLAKRQ
jgi:ubiquinone/menaquinone biosynthesis C-methylase UbiE